MSRNKLSQLRDQAQKAAPERDRSALSKFAQMSDMERRLRAEIAAGGQRLELPTPNDPTQGLEYINDPARMATGMPMINYEANPSDWSVAGQGLQASADYLTPAYLRPDYQGPQTGMGPVADAAAGLGQLFQAGSATGPMGAPSVGLAQLAGRLPAADRAFGTMGGVKPPRLGKSLADLAAEEATAPRPTLDAADEAAVAKIRRAMHMFDNMPPPMEMTPERAAQIEAEVAAERAANPPSEYRVPTMEEILKDRRRLKPSKPK